VQTDSDWTVDPRTGRSNSSNQFVSVCDEVERLVRSEAHALMRGDAASVARLIVANLAHKHGLVPTPRNDR